MNRYSRQGWAESKEAWRRKYSLFQKKIIVMRGFRFTATLREDREGIWGFPVSSVVKNLPASAGDAGSIPGLEDPLEKKMAVHPSILAWRIPWTEEPGGQGPGVTERQTGLKPLSTHAHDPIHPSLLNHTENFHSPEILWALPVHLSLTLPLANPWSFITSIILAFLECHILGITFYAGFSDCLLRLSNMHLRFPCIFSGLGSSLLFRTA